MIHDNDNDKYLIAYLPSLSSQTLEQPKGRPSEEPSIGNMHRMDYMTGLGVVRKK